MAKSTSKDKEKEPATKEKSAKSVSKKTVTKEKPIAKPKAKKEALPETIITENLVAVTKEKSKAKPRAKKEVSKDTIITESPAAETNEKSKAKPKAKKEVHQDTSLTDSLAVETVKTKGSSKKVETEILIEVTVEKKLVALYSLQQVDSEINKIRIVRGELPLEVQDLEDEIEGLETRIKNFSAEIKDIENEIKSKKAAIKEHQSQIKKYEAQQMNVRNNREYDSITKEIEFQTLEIQLCEKKIKEFSAALELKNEVAQSTIQHHKERKEDLSQKKLELDEIVAETEKEEKKLNDKLKESQKYIEERLITAYQRIKKNAHNGLAVVMFERDACGGCFNKIPPQRQLDIKMHKKIIVCEYCGRILVDSAIDELVRANN